MQLGIDFGTAFTKAALRVGGEHRAVVSWEGLIGRAGRRGEEGEAAAACLPGAVHWEDSRLLPGPGHPERTCCDLKLPLLEPAGPPDGDAFRLAAGFLAWVIRYARAWLYRNPDLGPLARHRLLAWELAIGCPTEAYRNEARRRRFRELAEAAWWLAGSPAIDEVALHEAWAVRRSPAELGLAAEAAVLPELVAQLGGYAATGQVTHDGVHALLDVGAGTVDAATFSLGRPADPDGPRQVVVLLYQMVKPYGTWALAEHRTRGTGAPPLQDAAEPCQRAETFARLRNLPPAQVRRRDEAFAEALSRRLYTSVLKPTCTNARHGARGNRVWESHLPVFLTGGGAACPVYREAMERAQRRMLRELTPGNLVSRSFRFRPMDPAGYGWREIPEAVRRRASVALGLVEELDEVAIRRGPSGPRHRLRELPDHEELYPER